jgi:hypothetical protein
MSHRIVNTSGAAIQVTENGAGEPSLFTQPHAGFKRGDVTPDSYDWLRDEFSNPQCSTVSTNPAAEVA